MGLCAAIAKSFARIHWQNLIDFGVLPLTFADTADYERINQGDQLVLPTIDEAIQAGQQIELCNQTKNETYTVEHTLSDRQIEMMLAGGQINLFRQQK